MSFFILEVRFENHSEKATRIVSRNSLTTNSNIIELNLGKRTHYYTKPDSSAVLVKGP